VGRRGGITWATRIQIIVPRRRGTAKSRKIRRLCTVKTVISLPRVTDPRGSLPRARARAYSMWGGGEEGIGERFSGGEVGTL